MAPFIDKALFESLYILYSSASISPDFKSNVPPSLFIIALPLIKELILPPLMLNWALFSII